MFGLAEQGRDGCCGRRRMDGGGGGGAGGGEDEGDVDCCRSHCRWTCCTKGGGPGFARHSGQETGLFVVNRLCKYTLAVGGVSLCNVALLI